MSARTRVLVFLLCLGAFLDACHKASQAQSQAQSRRVLYYQDPMHPSYRSDHPGIAPDCHMELVPVYANAGESIERPGGVRENQEQAAAIGLRTEPPRGETLA